jgi:hypothetical protein
MLVNSFEIATPIAAYTGAATVRFDAVIPVKPLPRAITTEERTNPERTVDNPTASAGAKGPEKTSVA